MYRDASDRPRGVDSPTPLVACSPAMLDVMRLVACYSRARTPVLLVGETGTGKGLIARELHRASGRTGPFVVLTAAELRGTLGGDVLFGHEAGAFTGAGARRKGMLAQAAEGTLLIDDFHHLRAAQQIKLLRVLEEGWWRPHGADREAPVQCRVVVTLPRDPDRLVRERRLLPDIRYRLGQALIRLPRLAQRPADIPLLAARFLARAPAETGVEGGPTAFAPAVLAVLQTADWPGNLRELRTVVHLAYLHAAGELALEVRHLPVSYLKRFRCPAHSSRSAKLRLIRRALALTGGDPTAAAQLAGMSRATVYRAKARLERPSQLQGDSTPVRRDDAQQQATA